MHVKIASVEFGKVLTYMYIIVLSCALHNIWPWFETVLILQEMELYLYLALDVHVQCSITATFGILCYKTKILNPYTSTCELYGNINLMFRLCETMVLWDNNYRSILCCTESPVNGVQCNPFIQFQIVLNTVWSKQLSHICIYKVQGGFSIYRALCGGRDQFGMCVIVLSLFVYNFTDWTSLPDTIASIRKYAILYKGSD